MQEGKRLGPYEILNRIGSGGMGEVYRALDSRLEREVALKFLPDRLRADAKAVRRFFWEARAASALNHPNIVTVYDIGDADGGHFIAMELVRGQTLGAFRGQVLKFESLLRIASQMASALAAAHAENVVHRDIKPENVMLRDDGYIKILDFGLARLKDKSDSTGSTIPTRGTSETGRIAGTLRYMSPEQARGESLDAATDIFSFGIVLYELATGRHPFQAESHFGVVDGILNRRPLTPTRVNPQIPGWFESLLFRMLDKRPGERPKASEAVRALGAGHVLTPVRVSVTTFERRTVGRSKERDALRAAFELTAARQGQVVCIAGEPGIGKSTFVEEFFSELRACGASFFVGRGKSSESLAGTEAYLPFLEALESLLGDDSALAQIMKIMAPSWYNELSPMTDSSTGERARNESGMLSLGQFKREIAAFIQEISLAKPVILFFDDIHWADDSTIDVLVYLASKIESMALLFVVAYRPEELQLRGHSFLRIRRDLQARGVAREIALDFLSVEDVQQYLSMEFPSHSFPTDFPRLIHAKTEGNPLFMVDVLHFLRDRRIIARQDERWSLVQSVPDIERMLPESIRGMIQRKIDLVEEADRKLLMAAAVQGPTFEAVVVAAAMQTDAAEVEERLDRLERVHALVRRGHEKEFPDGTLTLQYQFVHILYRNVIYAAITPARKASLSAGVAVSLEKLYGHKAGDVSSSLAVLWEAARDFDRAMKYFLAASRDATRVFAHREAVLLARRGLDLLKLAPHGPERSRLELDLLLAIGVPLTVSEGFASSSVQEVYVRARLLCEGLGENDRLIRILRGLWSVRMVRLDLNEAGPIAAQLQNLFGAEGGRYRVLRHLVAGLTGFYRGEYALSCSELKTALGYWNPDDEQRYLEIFPYDHAMECEATLGRICWAMGHPDKGLEYALAAVGRSRHLKNFHSLVYALYFAALLHHYRGELDEFESVVAEMEALSAEHRHSHFAALAAFLSGYVVIQRGETERGLRQMAEGLERYRAVEAASSLPHFLSLMAEAYGGLSDSARGLALVNEALEISEKGGAHYYDAELWRVRGLLSAKSQPKDAGWAEANRCMERAVAVAREQGTRSFELRAAMDLFEHWAGTGDAAAAGERLHEVFLTFKEGLQTRDLRRARALLRL